MQYRVTAKVTFDYDSADGLVNSAADARTDVLDMLASGLDPDDFTIDVTETESSYQPVTVTEPTPLRRV